MPRDERGIERRAREEHTENPERDVRRRVGDVIGRRLGDDRLIQDLAEVELVEGQQERCSETGGQGHRQDDPTRLEGVGAGDDAAQGHRVRSHPWERNRRDERPPGGSLAVVRVGEEDSGEEDDQRRLHSRVAHEQRGGTDRRRDPERQLAPRAIHECAGDQPHAEDQQDGVQRQDDGYVVLTEQQPDRCNQQDVQMRRRRAYPHTLVEAVDPRISQLSGASPGDEGILLDMVGQVVRDASEDEQNTGDHEVPEIVGSAPRSWSVRGDHGWRRYLMVARHPLGFVSSSAC